MYEPDYDMLVNKVRVLPENYVPGILRTPDILFQAEDGDPRKQMEYKAAAAAELLFAQSRRDGCCLFGVSGYRSYERQRQLYEAQKDNSYVAKPGTSEHQTGLALDVSCPEVNLELTEEFANTDEGRWLCQNAALYGFIIRYPRDKEEITGYPWEPWHIRYVTKGLALYLRMTGLTLEEYHRCFVTAPFGVP